MPFTPPTGLPPLLPPWMTGGAPSVPRPTLPPPPQTIGPAQPVPETAPSAGEAPGVGAEGEVGDQPDVQMQQGDDPLVSIVRALIEGATLEDADGQLVADFSILPQDLRDSIKQVLTDYQPQDQGEPPSAATPPAPGAPPPQ